VESASVTTWRDAPVEEVLPGITRQVVNGERQTLVRYVYQPGSVFPIHHHPEEQITVVVSGEIEFEVDGASVVLTAGQVAVIPSNVPHGAWVTGPEVVETFNSLSPRRSTNPYGGTTRE
jgi:quercetin dioxygenase-like cupin family protein